MNVITTIRQLLVGWLRRLIATKFRSPALVGEEILRKRSDPLHRICVAARTRVASFSAYPRVDCLLIRRVLLEKRLELLSFNEGVVPGTGGTVLVWHVHDLVGIINWGADGSSDFRVESCGCQKSIALGLNIRAARSVERSSATVVC